MAPVLTVGTRGSDLALRQTALVVDALRRLHPDAEFAVQTIQSQGDRRNETPLSALGLGIFVTELEDALLDRRVDLVVHSLKDLPTDLLPGTTVVPVLERADPRDALIDRWDAPLNELPSGARIGTSSPRREAQLRAARPDLRFLAIRGNVDTRVSKAIGRDYDGAVVAAAGLVRLGLAERVAEYLPPHVCTPAPGQGALAVEVRAEDAGLLCMVRDLEHRETVAAVEAERWVLRVAGGGCQVPVGALAVVDGPSLRLAAASSALDGSAAYRVEISWSADDPEGAGKAAYQALLAKGAGVLMGVEERP